MFVEINDFYLNTNYISDVNKSTVEVDDVTKYLLTYVLTDGSTVEELFDTESEANTKLDEIEKSGWIGNLTNIYVYKGSCLYAQLPQTGNSVGDVWNVEDEFTLGGVTYPAGTNVAWAGSSWDVLAGTIDTSTFELKSNKTTTITNNSTDIQYPSAKAVYTLSTGLQSKITSSNKLDSDLVDDTNQTNKFVTAQEKSDWNAKSDFSGSYNDLTDKPSIPDSTSDLTNDSGYITNTVNDLTNYTKTTDLAAVATTGEFASLLHKPTTVSGYGITDAVQQVTTMPTASSSLVDRVVQYVGTTGTYINSYFYKCVNNSGTYAWEAVSVQAGGGGNDWDYVLRTVYDIGYKSPTWASLSYAATDLIPQLNQILTDGIFEDGTIKPLKIVIVTTDSSCGAYDGMFILQSIYLNSEYSPTYYFAFKDYDVNITLRCVVENNTNTWSYRAIDATDTCIAKYTTMPTADYDLVDTIVQYVGTTDANYTNGYFYKCVEYATDYGWERIDVQPTPTFENIQVQDIANVTSSSATPNINFSTIKPGIYHIRYDNMSDWSTSSTYFYYIITGSIKGYFSDGKVKYIYVGKSFTEAVTNEIFGLATVVKFMNGSSSEGLEINYQIKKTGSSSITFVEDTLNSASVDIETTLTSLGKVKQATGEVDLGYFNPTSLSYDLYYNKNSDMYDLISEAISSSASYGYNKLLGKKLLFKFTEDTVSYLPPEVGTAISDRDHFYVAFHPIYSFSSGCGIEYQYILSSPILNLGKATGVIYIIFSYYNHTSVGGYPEGVTISFRFLENKVTQNDGTSKFSLDNTPVTKSYVDNSKFDYIINTTSSVINIYAPAYGVEIVDTSLCTQLNQILTNEIDFTNHTLKPITMKLIISDEVAYLTNINNSSSYYDEDYAWYYRYNLFFCVNGSSLQTTLCISVSCYEYDSNPGVLSDFYYGYDVSGRITYNMTSDNTYDTYNYPSVSAVKTYAASSTLLKYSTMPIASGSHWGKVAMYTGTTNATYTNGYFYNCIYSNGYKWQRVDVQPAPSLTGYEQTSNKVTSMSSSSTDTEYPSAKCVYDYIDTHFPDGMYIMSYGHSTWNDFITAYQKRMLVYCRASSSSNPATGSQTRMAFMAYVNNADNPTEVEFQYYRSVSSHTASQQGDQVFVYKLTSSGTWTVTVREASVKVVAGTGLTSTYSNNTITLKCENNEVTTNKVTSISSSSTDTQYPSAKAVYDAIAAIIDSGSDTNGNYIKYADGTMIEWNNLTVTDQALDNAYGSLYQGTRTITFPVAFVGSTPSVQCSQFQWGTSASWGSVVEATLTSLIVRGMDIAQRATGTNCTISWFAIGKWK